MQITAKIIKDSINPFNGKRITTIETVFPRLILAEVNTHGLIKRNTRSVRAVPTQQLINEVKSSPYIPQMFRTRKPGMAGGVPLVGGELEKAKREWLFGSYDAVRCAEKLLALNVAKEHAGRVLEPYMWTTSIWTATEWSNMIALRNTDNAQPEFRVLAEKIEKVLNDSVPVERCIHFPYIDLDDDVIAEDYQFYMYACAGRCARVSYNQFDGSTDLFKDYDFGVDLYHDGHMSPFAHGGLALLDHNGWSDSFHGWVQVRKTLPLEADFSKRTV